MKKLLHCVSLLPLFICFPAQAVEIGKVIGPFSFNGASVSGQNFVLNGLQPAQDLDFSKIYDFHINLKVDGQVMSANFDFTEETYCTQNDANKHLCSWDNIDVSQISGRLPNLPGNIEKLEGYWTDINHKKIPHSSNPVPEPITGLVFAAGLGGVALKRAKDKSKKS